MTTDADRHTHAILDKRFIDDNFHKQLFENLPIGYALFKIIYDEKGIPYDYEFKEVNSIFEEKTGLNRDGILGERLAEVFNLNNESLKLNTFVMKSVTEGKQEAEFYYKDVSRWYRTSLYYPGGNYVVMYLIDITYEKNQLIELEHSRRRMENIIEGTNVGTWELNLETGERFYNRRWTEMLGYTLEELEPINDKTWHKLVYPEDIKAQLDRDKKLYNKEIEFYDEEYRMIHKNGSIVWIQDRGKVISWTKDGKPQIISGTHTDITKRKNLELALEHVSYCDQLTGLYNRRYFEDKLKEADVPDNLPITLIMADVNGLKLVNDSFGHRLGDELLKKTSMILKKGCRKKDIISRLGGDEFVVILTQTSSLQAEQIIKRINSIASNEKVGSIDISISFGYKTKKNSGESIQDTLKNAEDYMYRHKLYESSDVRNKTINLIMNTLYEKSYMEMLHSRRVSEICAALATRMNFEQGKINQMRMAGLMHDIGKMGIDETILNKPQKLNDEERREIRRHSEIGYRILSSSNEFSEIAEYVLKHHERWDGKGYPGGFKGEEISVQARIIAIADAYDTMTSDRPYRKSLRIEDALAELKRCSGTQFDAYIASVLIDMVMEQQADGSANTW